MAEIKAAGAICYLKDGKDLLFLILRSSKHGEWGPPKGKAESGETEVETATRELYEEAGLRKLSFDPKFREILSYTIDKKGQKLPKQVVYFLCQIESDDVKLSHEHTEAHLATLAELEIMIPHDDMREIFRRAAKHIQQK
ncbi:MAG TPA: NUDIX domain-containing protein [Planctomycetota bacterium]|nr:NUDIX domain-containing protein [Planctomycetota bacterium]